MLAFLLLSVLAPPAPATTPGSICELARTDLTSRQCLGCHDGSIGTHADVGLTSPLGGSHPVDVDYEAARLARPTTLVPSGLLPRAILLPGGKVTCTSCHDADSPEPKRTSLTMAGSALCQACHAR